MHFYYHWYFITQAADKDFGENGEIRYNLEAGNIGNVFKIDELRYLANFLIKQNRCLCYHSCFSTSVLILSELRPICLFLINIYSRK